MELVLKKNIQWMLNLQKYMIPNVVLKPVYILMRSKMASLFWTVKTVPDFFLKNIVLFLLFSFNSPLLLPFFFLLVLSVSIFSYPISPLAFPFFSPSPSIFLGVSLARLSLPFFDSSLPLYIFLILSPLSHSPSDRRTHKSRLKKPASNFTFRQFLQNIFKS